MVVSNDDRHPTLIHDKPRQQHREIVPFVPFQRPGTAKSRASRCHGYAQRRRPFHVHIMAQLPPPVILFFSIPSTKQRANETRNRVPYLTNFQSTVRPSCGPTTRGPIQATRVVPCRWKDRENLQAVDLLSHLDLVGGPNHLYRWPSSSSNQSKLRI